MGVAIVLNKLMVETEGVRMIEIVPGRALLLETKHADGSPLSILGIYAPNGAAENTEFLKKLIAFFKDEANRNIRRPDIVAGDFNMVESGIDRLPAHSDPASVVNAMDELTSKVYTYFQTEDQGGSCSRVDRILVKRDQSDNVFEWAHAPVGFRNNHWMVSMKITTVDAPTLGHGRWSWLERGRNLEDNLRTLELAIVARDTTYNPQLARNTRN
ncbi:hypothetical protein C8F01DRAFT_1138220 [Mycena amicta]|nr:hypothetical protein C8F01DRAFT_1138220 [Mycena amicta]